MKLAIRAIVIIIAAAVLAGCASDPTAGYAPASLYPSTVTTVAVARANSDALDRLRRGGLLEPDGPLVTFATINAAVRAFRRQRPGG